MVSEQSNSVQQSSKEIRQLSYPQPQKAELRSASLRSVADNWVQIKTHYSGISRGTESLVFNGLVPESQWEIMRCPHMTGSFAFPVSYGYACVGTVTDKSNDINHLNVNDRVFCLHPHQNAFIASADFCCLVPDDVPSTRAVLAANMETALNAVWDAEISSSETALVIGAGLVGFLTAHALRTVAGIEPLVLDVNPARHDIAEKLSLKFANPDMLSNERFDVIFHTSASQEGLQTAIDKAAFEGRIIEMSWFGDKQVSLELGGAFHSQRLRIIGSQVGEVAKPKRDEISHSQRMHQAMALLSDDRLDHLLEPELDFDILPDHLQQIFASNSSILCQVVRY